MTRDKQVFESGTWLESEDYAYPAGGVYAGRRARAVIRPNQHNPIALDYGSVRVVHVGIPDTAFTIPARLRRSGHKAIVGYVSMDTNRNVLLFTPEANPSACCQCVVGEGCK